MTNIADELSQLSPRKRALFELLLKEKGEASVASQGIPRRDPSQTAPPSFAQQRLWFHDQFEPGSPLYNLPVVLRLKGSLDVEALRQALHEIVRRHEALRTTFDATNGDPLQVVAEDASVVIPLMELSSLPEAERQAEAQRLVAEEVRRPFDLTADLMLRATLLKLGEEEHIFILVLHHVASDGWSLGVLFRELSTLYQNFTSGEPVMLPELPIQYADFASWQRGWLRGEELENQIAYWRKQLDGAPALLELPTERPRPPVQTFNGARVSSTFGADLSARLNALSRRESATLYMTLLAAFQTLLYRYTGQKDIVVGSPIAGRTRAETEKLIGFFVNTLVMRTNFSGDPTFCELLSKVRETALDAYDHQDLPFEKLVEELKPARNLNHTPLFQVMFALQNAPRQPLRLPGVTLTTLEIEDTPAKFDLVFYMTEDAGELRVRVEYNIDLFERTTIERMLSHFGVLLRAVADDPSRRISELPLLTDSELRQQLVEWNATETSYPRGKCIHELFEAQVERTPDAVAVVFGEQHITYGELNRSANRVAHRLRESGVKPDALVGICMERSIEFVVGLLGILKAGGAYLPLDPTYPAGRLAFMLEDAQVSVLLTQRRLIASLPEHTGEVIAIDADDDSVARGEANLHNETKAEDLAYVMYTSGSTGQPKGICIPHRAVVRLVCDTNYVHLDASDRVAQISNSSFDAATFEIWGALLHGARLVLFTKSVALSPHEFAAQISEQGITVMFLTTALFNELARATPHAFSRIKSLLFGGEAVDPKWVAKVLDNNPPQRLLHVYGPTESTTFASWHLVQDRLRESSTIPIGRPLSNTQFYVLDRNRQPVPIGVAGELYIGGDGLARGYLNRSELTAERFIRNPFSEEDGAPLYKTGDRVRYLPDGSLEFLGRNDHQVKLRGFRIELEEIEAMLNTHAEVSASVVIAREYEPNDKRLVAYVVARQTRSLGQAEMEDELRSFLRGRLPNYMVPDAFVSLETLPLTPNGKVDRQALPAPERARDALEERAYVAPRDALEQQLTDIWEEVLGVAPICVHDNFFDLGGHSLLAVRMMSLIERACGRKLPLAELFANATVAHLARALLRHRAGEDQQSNLVPIQPRGSRRPFFFLHGDFNGGGFYCSKLAEHLGDAQPVYALQPHGLDGRRIPATIEEMAADYVKTLRAFQPEGPYLLGGFCHGGLIAFEMARRLRRLNQEVDLLALIFAPAKNVRYKSQRRLVANLGKLFRLKPDVELDWFLRLRKLHTHLGDLSWVQRINFFLRKTQRLGAATGEFAASAPRDEPPTEERTLDFINGFHRHSKEVLTKYKKAVHGYVPGRYSGTVTLFWPQEAKSQSATDPTMGWHEVAAEVVVDPVPGEHLTCITTHIQTLAERLKVRLDEVQPRDSSLHK